MPHNTATPWLIDNIDVRHWYYRDAPPIGSTVAYMNETYIDTVTHVTPFTIELASGSAMRRPYLTSRFLAWITATLHNRPSATSSNATQQHEHAGSNRNTSSPRRLRPDMTVLA